MISRAVPSFQRSSGPTIPQTGARHPYATVFVAVFLILVVLPIGLHIGPLYLTGTRIFLIVLIVPLFIDLIRGRFGPILLTDWLFIFHFIWIILSLWINNPDQLVQNAGSTGIEFLGGYMIGRACVRDSASFVRLVRMITTLIICCLPFALIEAVTGTSVLIVIADRLPLVATPVDLGIDKRLGLERVQMGFEHPIHWGLFCSVATALCFITLRHRSSLRSRAALTALICAAGLLALSSGAILAIAIQLGLIIWAALFDKNAKRWAILLGLIIFCYVFVDILSNRSPLQVFMSYATFSAHSAYWRSTIFEWGMVNVWANPLFGLGLGDWIRPIWMHTSSVDNFWLLITMRYGLPAFFFLAAGFIYALCRIARRNLNPDSVEWSCRRAWMFCFVGLSFTLTTVHVWGAIYALVFFIFGAGMWLSPETKRTPATMTSRFSTSTSMPFCRQHEISSATFYTYKSKYGAMHCPKRY